MNKFVYLMTHGGAEYKVAINISSIAMVFGDKNPNRCWISFVGLTRVNDLRVKGSVDEVTDKILSANK